MNVINREQNRGMTELRVFLWKKKFEAELQKLVEKEKNIWIYFLSRYISDIFFIPLVCFTRTHIKNYPSFISKTSAGGWCRDDSVLGWIVRFTHFRRDFLVQFFSHFCLFILSGFSSESGMRQNSLTSFSRQLHCSFRPCW